MRRFIFLVPLCFFAAGLFSQDVESVEKQHAQKVEAEKKKYEEAVKKISADTIKKLDVLMKQETKAGKLKEAVEIQNKIAKLKGEEGIKMNDAGDASGELELPGVDSPISPSDAKLKKDLEKRYTAFYSAVLENNMDEARKYIDPDTVANVNEDVIDGFLKLFVGYMKIGGIKDDSDLGVKDITLGAKRKDAKLVGKFKLGGLKWEEQKAQYWFIRNGKWYLGDEKKLNDFK